MKASLKAMLEEHMIDFLDEIDGCRDNPHGLAHPERNADATQGKCTRDWNTRHALPNTQGLTDAENQPKKPTQ